MYVFFSASIKAQQRSSAPHSLQSCTLCCWYAWQLPLLRTNNGGRYDLAMVGSRRMECQQGQKWMGVGEWYASIGGSV